MKLKEQIPNYSSLTENQIVLISGNFSYGDNFQNNEQETSISNVLSRIDIEVAEHVQYLDNNYRSRLVAMIYHECFFPGESNETIAFVGLLRRYTDVALEKWINNLYAEYFNTPIVLRGLLYIILYFSDIFDATLANVAIASIANDSCEIQELGVRMLESTCCKKHLEALKGLKKQDTWLQEYIDQVKSDFEKQLCLS